VVCTVTSAKAPIVRGEWCRPGQHLNLVGSAIPTTAEVDDLTVSRARFFVDYREAAMAAAGELLGAISRGVVGESHVLGEIGEVFAGLRPGRIAGDDITLYKSLGVTTQDLAAAMRLLREAGRVGAGRELDLGA
jgi:ornithine cyclodeaminase